MAKILSLIFFLISLALITVSLSQFPGITGILIAAGGLLTLGGSWGFWRMSKKDEQKNGENVK